MTKTLQQILIEANAVLDLEAAAPTGTELDTRQNYAHQAVAEAAATGQLREFTKEFLGTASTLATVPLPSDFNEFQEWPRISTGGAWQAYEPILPGQKYERSADYVCYVLGNPVEGYVAVFNNIIASSTLSIIYQRSPSGLLTLADKCELSDPQYVVKKIESYVLFSRSDDRFQIAEQRAQSALANMVGRSMKSPDGLERTTPANFKNPLR